MKLTTNYNLKKPEGSDVVNIEDFNENADKIDAALQENKKNITALQNELGTNKVTLENNINAIRAVL